MSSGPGHAHSDDDDNGSDGVSNSDGDDEEALPVVDDTGQVNILVHMLRNEASLSTRITDAQNRLVGLASQIDALNLPVIGALARFDVAEASFDSLREQFLRDAVPSQELLNHVILAHHTLGESRVDYESVFDLRRLKIRGVFSLHAKIRYLKECLCELRERMGQLGLGVHPKIRDDLWRICESFLSLSHARLRGLQSHKTAMALRSPVVPFSRDLNCVYHAEVSGLFIGHVDGELVEPAIAWWSLSSGSPTIFHVALDSHSENSTVESDWSDGSDCDHGGGGDPPPELPYQAINSYIIHDALLQDDGADQDGCAPMDVD